LTSIIQASVIIGSSAAHLAAWTGARPYRGRLNLASPSVVPQVASYLADQHDPKLVDAELNPAEVKTRGPSGSFGAVLFIEKEGFDQHFKAAQIAEKFDLAIMSTKGMSVTPARALVDQMCHDHDIPLLLLHDFDKSGFLIAGTLQRDTRRYEFQNFIKVIDLGLSLADVEAMGLENEYQHHPKGNKAALIANMRENGATDADIAFMFRDFDTTRSTRRFELNAMTSPQFIRLRRAQAEGSRHQEDRAGAKTPGRCRPSSW
jgi:hypothetical protein